jgi:homoserine O-acetyltransferase/O-succinyltransferase
VSYCNIESDAGHDAFLLEVEVMEKIVGGFLEHVEHEAPEEAGAIVLDTPKQPPYATQNIYEGERIDYEMIVDLVDEGSRVLDLGCADGELLSRLIRQKNVHGMGVEVDQTRIVNCIRRGVSVFHANIDEGLSQFPDNSYDYVILSMTLQVVKKPDFVMREMVRVGKKCIVSFPNFAFWKVRLLTTAGKAPVTRNLPYEWYNSPNRHVLSIRDFREFCRTHGFRVEREIPLSLRGAIWVKTWPNMFADEALYILSGV